jgi:hypothetical protein
MPTTVGRRRKNLYYFSPIWNFEQAQAPTCAVNRYLQSWDVADETEKWAKVIRAANIKAQ